MGFTWCLIVDMTRAGEDSETRDLAGEKDVHTS